MLCNILYNKIFKSHIINYLYAIANNI